MTRAHAATVREEPWQDALGDAQLAARTIGMADLRVARPRTSVVHSTVRGTLEREAAAWLRERLAAILPDASGLVLFHDWHGLEGYDADARAVLRELLRGAPAVRETHLLLAPGSSAMALRVAAALGPASLRTYASRDAFRAALSTELAR